ncbi:MAG: DNA photolyase, partial [bacterium]|nr:DNA photolyase [bacterium]
MSDPVIKKVMVEEGALKHDLSKKILNRISDTPIQQITEMNPERDLDSSGMGKDTLHLISYKGEFLKPCPGTQKYICCGYQILNLSMNCPIDCSYCILQSYFNQPNLR